MTPEIKILSDKKLMGKSIKMSYANNATKTLWQSFMPLKKHIVNSISSDLYSMQIYPSVFSFYNFNPNVEFTKWAAIEVSDFNIIPEGIDTYILKGGLYVVFPHKGPTSQFFHTFQRIFTGWLPTSDFEIDHREHFELLGEKYSNADPNSEEEIWVPIKLKI